MSNGAMLYKFVRKGQLDKARQIIKNGADVNNGSFYIAVEKGRINMMRLLIDNGANVNILNNIGSTPCHTAARMENIDILKFLVSYGAIFDIKNKFGFTPRDEAIRYGRKHVVVYLDVLVRIREIICLLIGIRKQRMEDLQIFPIEIILMIAKYIWATRDDILWIK